jgi:phenylacetate-CoA ligase
MSVDSILHLYRGLYYKMPQSFKTLIGSVYGSVPLSIRFGKPYVLHEKTVRTFESMDRSEQEQFLYQKILETLRFAETHIPYYQKRFKEHGVSSEDFKSLGDLAKFPTMTKQDVKENLYDLYTDKFEKPADYYTGGSLSTPTKYFHPLYTSRAKEKAYNNFMFEKIGYRYRDKTLLLKGREISKPEEDIYWEYEPIDNYFYISNNYMNSSKFPLIYEQSKAFKPKFAFGYPSALLSFIKQCKKHNLPKLDIQGVMLSSESVYPDEIEMIRDFFGVDVFSHYGHTERAIMAYRINTGRYHFMRSYGVARVVDGELIATGFDNNVMPLINYKSGDTASGDIEFHEGTDIAITCESIEGRTQDFLVTDDNRLVSITTMCGGQHLPLEQIANLQYIQNEPGKTKVLIEPLDKEHNPIDPNDVIHGMKQLVRDGIDFEVEFVDNIEKSSRGKRIICKQSLDIEKIRASN